MSATVPFTALEEAVFHIERKYSPWNVQIEVTAEEIDAERVHEAAVDACNSHPLARARRKEHQGLDTELRWEIPDSVESVPVDETYVGSDRELGEVRTRFYSGDIDLTDGVPFRVLVTHRDGQDRLLVCASHVPCDGVGALRFTRSVCQAYRGEEVDDDPVGFERSRQVLEDARPTSLSERLRKIGNAATHLGNTVDAADNIVKQGSVSRDDWGFVHRSLDALTGRIIKNRPDGVSVNDVFVTALHLTIDEWNREHGDPAEKISIMMPVNLRPRDWFYDVVGMYALFESVETRETDRRMVGSALHKVANQTRYIKEKDKAVSFLESLRLIPPETPVELRGQIAEFLRGPGHRLVDCAVLSNLGRVPEPTPRLGDEPGEIWFSPPTLSMIPVGVGVVTSEGTARVVLRHLLSHLGRKAGQDFADTYVEKLEEISG
jgi:NRPS condensation-like uncharacterized protein